MDLAALEAALLVAHDAGDGAALVQLYTQAGDLREQAGDIDAACFYLTHAFVYALQEGDPSADALNLRLFNHGRVHRLSFP